MGINKEKFKKFYKFDIKNDNLRILKEGKAIYPNWGKNIYITYDQKPKDQEDADKLLEEGKIDKTTLEELYRELLNYTENEIIEKREAMDIRSYNYLEAVKENLGIVNIVFDKKEIESKYFIKKIKKDMFNDAGVFKIEDKYIIEFGSFNPPDDYAVIQIYLSKEPKDNFFKTDNLINKATDLLNRQYRNNKDNNREGTLFKCRTCGSIKHWLDCKNTFIEKIDSLENFDCCE